MLLDLLHDLGLSVIFAVMAFIAFDWSRIWWFARRHGYIQVDRRAPTYNHHHRWDTSYLGYKVWTWVVRLAAWLVSIWHLALSICWFVQAVTWASVS